MEAILQCDHLHKQIHKRTVLDHVSFSLYRGETLGILGAAGAGKTTLLKQIMGLSHPDRGQIKIGGYTVDGNYEQAMKKIRCVFSSDYFYKNLTGRQNLQLFLRGQNVLAQTVEWALDFVGLNEIFDQKVGTYTPDSLRLLSIVHALCEQPEILVLDDFFLSMTSWQIKNFGDQLKKLVREREMTILLTLQSYSCAELLCDRVGFLCDGKMMYIKTMAELRSESGRIPYRFEMREIARARRLLSDAYSIVVVGEGRNYLDLSITRDEIPVYNKLFVDNKIEVFGIERRELSIEQTLSDMRGGKSL